MQFHHVQIALPAGQEEQARRFYSDALGLTEVGKPPDLAGRGGCWFRHLDGEITTLEIHLGVEEPFTPARKAHPAILVDSVQALKDLGDRIDQAGFEVSWAERSTFAGYERFHCKDPFGNRIEVMAAST
ncbi:MAG TPA: VOC family protein [Armatimonadota bacterium]|nr:VOC family protein [Armatimonadota bacterium]